MGESNCGKLAAFLEFAKIAKGPGIQSHANVRIPATVDVANSVTAHSAGPFVR